METETAGLYTFIATVLVIAIIGMLIYFACKERAQTFEEMSKKEKPLPCKEEEK
jgi:heme/copper-type cytochrome/quinol oxidase subunit 2